MKYLKAYENLRFLDDSSFAETMIYIDEDQSDPRLKNLKFKLGDYVKHKKYDKMLFQIIGIDINPTTSSPYRIQEINKNFIKWSTERDLTVVPDYEIAAIKYNL